MSIASEVMYWRDLITKSHDNWVGGKFAPLVEAQGDSSSFMQLAWVMNSPRFHPGTELVWVSSPMVELVAQAAKTLAPYDWSAEVMPWGRAIVVGQSEFIRSKHELVPEGQRVNALQWSDFLGPSRCIVVAWVHTEGFHRMGPVPLAISNIEAGKPVGSGRVENPYREHDMEFPHHDFAKMLCALWLLVRQRIALRERVQPERAIRRRLAREGIPEPGISVIRLRQPESSAAVGEATEVEWSRRWIVGGHWRNQYHPSDGSHVPTWIAPYVKGPEDKPLVVNEIIKAWVR